MIDKNEIVLDLVRVKEELGHIPNKNEYRQNGKYGLTTIPRKFGTWNNAIMETFGEIKNKTRRDNVTINCKYCGTEKIIFASAVGENNFCSRKCAATYNNKKKPKRAKKAPIPKNCRSCNSSFYGRSAFCPQCKSQGKNLRCGKKIVDQPLSFYQAKSKNANRYSSIRDHARKIMKNKPQVCRHCGYDKFVETCHIKDIGDFSPETKVGEINNPLNLVLLCPNHHWELDHDILKLDPAGFEPAMEVLSSQDYES